MKVTLNDGTSVDVMRVYKTWDFQSSTARLSIELVPGVDPMELAENDFSSITVTRSGMPDLQFDGYSVAEVSESYEDRATNVSINLAKVE